MHVLGSSFTIQWVKPKVKRFLNSLSEFLVVIITWTDFFDRNVS